MVPGIAPKAAFKQAPVAAQSVANATNSTDEEPEGLTFLTVPSDADSAMGMSIQPEEPDLQVEVSRGRPGHVLYMPGNTRRSTSVRLTLAQRRRRWANVQLTLVEGLVFPGIILQCKICQLPPFLHRTLCETISSNSVALFAYFSNH